MGYTLCILYNHGSFRKNINFVFLLPAILASTVPYLEYIISLFGATTSATLSITLPPILHSISVPKISKFTMTKNIIISLLGIAVTIMGTTVLIQKAIYLYDQPMGYRLKDRVHT